MKTHEAASLFPLMTDEEFAGLVADIREYGQREPILMYQGQILDGRNRWRACSDLGLTPKTQEWDGEGSPTSVVISLNLRRRHLSADQQKAIAADAIEHYRREAKERQREHAHTAPGKAAESLPLNSTEVKPTASGGEATQQAARDFKVSDYGVRQAVTVKEKAPDLHEKVKAGEMRLKEAAKETAKREMADVVAVLADAVPADDATAELVERYLKAVVWIDRHLIPLDALTLVDGLDGDHRQTAAYFIRRLRDWLESLESALETPKLRAI